MGNVHGENADARGLVYFWNMPLGSERDRLIENLELLNIQIARQNSLMRMLLVGIIYGIGFFIGSAIIATIALGILGPIFANIGWIRTAFTTGLSMLH